MLKKNCYLLLDTAYDSKMMAGRRKRQIINHSIPLARNADKSFENSHILIMFGTRIHFTNSLNSQKYTHIYNKKIFYIKSIKRLIYVNSLTL